MIYEQRFLSLLRQRIGEELTKRYTELGDGAASVRDSATATGMNYARTTGMITGLRDALKLIEQVEEELSARGRKKGEE